MDKRYDFVKRENQEDVLISLSKIHNADYIRDIINALPYIAAILNKYRQVIFSNEVLLNQLSLSSIDEVIGLRPGELIHCVNSNKEEGGCGVSENCKVCGAFLSILDAQNKKQKSQYECRIKAIKDGKEIAYDFLATSTPIIWDNEEFIIFSLTDISSEKRRKALERTFFHDIINKAGSLQGFIQLIQSVSDFKEIKEYVSIASDISQELIDEILSQRYLVAAENNEFATTIESVETLSIMSSSIREISNQKISKDIHVIMDEKSVSVNIQTDITLLRRVLLNMLKNAVEASEKSDYVTLSGNLNDNKYVFKVHNNNFIPKDQQMQIFQRSFSTKGVDRGIGTYSMKLFTENYLDGRIYFESDINKGTTFFVELPYLETN
jgi:K+-sensing histidine kinase KdpD